MYIDIHTHLESYPDIDLIIDSARKAGVKIINYNGIDIPTNRKVLEYSKRFDIVKASLGLCPIDALKFSDAQFNDELEFIGSNANKIIGIGEVGLDYKEDSIHHEQQIKNFGRFIELSKELNKPLIIHSRKAESDVIRLLEENKAKKVVMHCFMGNMKLVERVITNNWTFSIPANITFSEHFQHVVKRTPIRQLLTETDGVFLSPFKGTKNEPANVIEGVKKIAEIKGLTLDDAANLIFSNYQELF